MLNAIGLGILFQAKDEAKEVVDKLESGLHGLKHAAGETHESLLSSLGGMSSIIAGTGIAIAGIATGAAFEFAEHSERMSSALVRAGVAAHASAEELHDLERVARTKSLDSMSGSAITTAEALEQLALEGMNAEESTQALTGTLQLMKMSMGALDSRSAAGVVNDTLAQFGMHADESSELADKLSFAMRNFGFRAEELKGTMSGLASGAQLTGSSLDDTLIGVGLIKQVFPSATRAAGAMNLAMVQLADTQKQHTIAQTLGISVVDHHTKKLRPLIDIMKDLSNKTAHMSEAQLSHTLEMIAGGRAAGGLSAIIDGLRKGVRDSNGNLLTGAAALEYYRKGITESGGSAKAMGDALNDDLGGALKAFKNAVSNAGDLFGEKFEQPFTRAIKAANLALRGLTQLFAQGGFSGEVMTEMDKADNGGIKKFVVIVFLAISRLKNFFGSLIDSFRENFKEFAPVVEALSQTFSALGMALGITGQGANDNASAFDSAGAAGSSIGGVLASVAGIMTSLLNAALVLITDAVITLREAWETLGPVVKGALGILGGAFEIAAGLLTGNWKVVWNGLVDVVYGAWKLILGVVYGAAGLIADVIDSLTFHAFDLKAKVTMASDAGTAFVDNQRDSAKLKDVSVSPAMASALRQESTFRRSGSEEDANGRPGFLTPQEHHVHSHVSLMVDGQKLAEVLAHSKRSSDARGFAPVDSAGGSAL